MIRLTPKKKLEITKKIYTKTDNSIAIGYEFIYDGIPFFIEACKGPNYPKNVVNTMIFQYSKLEPARICYKRNEFHFTRRSLRRIIYEFCSGIDWRIYSDHRFDITPIDRFITYSEMLELTKEKEKKEKRKRKSRLTNLLKETTSILNKDVKWAEITGCVDAILKPGYTKEEFEQFKSLLDIEYDADYGTQEVYGTIVLRDGSWWTRDEYDGSEWWQEHRCPTYKK